jgi:hypothetical protein
MLLEVYIWKSPRFENYLCFLDEPMMARHESLVRGLEPSFKLVIGAQVSCKDKVINQPIRQNSVTYLEETYSPY